VSRRRSVLSRVLCVLVAAGASLLAGAWTQSGDAAAGAAADGPAAGLRGIDVVQVNGALDPPNVSLVRSVIRDANRKQSTLLVIQLDSPGVVDSDVRPIVDAIRASGVPIAVWVGPAGSNAKGGAVELVAAAPMASVSPGSHLGPAYPLALDHPHAIPATKVAALLESVASASPRGAAGIARATRRRLSSAEAKRLGVVDAVEPTLVSLLGTLDGRSVVTPTGTHRLSLAKVQQTSNGPRRVPNQSVHFRKLGLAEQAIHTLTSPSIAYFLFVAGLALIVFEFFTAGVGLAGLAGAGALVGAFIGFSHLPVHPWAVALLAIGVLGFAIDVQAGGFGFWTIAGLASLLAGSLTLMGGEHLDPKWWVIVLVCGGTTLFMLAGMTAAVRSRFSTPTVGREGMVGEMGQAEVDVAPDGVVRIRDALWRARTNRATPIRAGDPVRVVEVQGLVLEVEPELGGARDHRHGSRSS
jgi:membrane-bound serine protease (ClpP class)